jgi:hypothetical protein
MDQMGGVNRGKKGQIMTSKNTPCICIFAYITAWTLRGPCERARKTAVFAQKWPYNRFSRFGRTIHHKAAKVRNTGKFGQFRAACPFYGCNMPPLHPFFAMATAYLLTSIYRDLKIQENGL